MLGDDCLYCDVEPVSGRSKFCSSSCREEYAKTMKESISCLDCFAEADGLKAAAAAGWTDFEPDPEGAAWNYRGRCPECPPDDD